MLLLLRPLLLLLLLRALLLLCALCCHLLLLLPQWQASPTNNRRRALSKKELHSLAVECGVTPDSPTLAAAATAAAAAGALAPPIPNSPTASGRHAGLRSSPGTPTATAEQVRPELAVLPVHNPVQGGGGGRLGPTVQFAALPGAAGGGGAGEGAMLPLPSQLLQQVREVRTTKGVAAAVVAFEQGRLGNGSASSLPDLLPAEQPGKQQDEAGSSSKLSTGPALATPALAAVGMPCAGAPALGSEPGPQDADPR